MRIVSYDLRVISGNIHSVTEKQRSAWFVKDKRHVHTRLMLFKMLVLLIIQEFELIGPHGIRYVISSEVKPVQRRF